MNMRSLCFALMFCFSMTACLSSRPTTHWVVNNDSNKEVSLNLDVYKLGSARKKRIAHSFQPGLHELAPETFSKGAYSVVAGTSNGIVSASKKIHFDTDAWVIISFTDGDSSSIHRKYGIVDTTVLKKINGNFTGLEIYKESRRPPYLYTFSAPTNPNSR